MPSRYLRLQRLRVHHAADTLLEIRAELRGAIRATDPHVPWLYAHRILESDDELGARDDYVVRGDDVSWRAIDALFDLAVLGKRTHDADAGHSGDPACATCRKFNEIWSVPIADRLRERRGLSAGTLLLDG